MGWLTNAWAGTILKEFKNTGVNTMFFIVPLDNFMIGFIGAIFCFLGCAWDSYGFDPLVTAIAVIGGIFMLIGFGSWISDLHQYEQEKKYLKERYRK